MRKLYIIIAALVTLAAPSVGQPAVHKYITVAGEVRTPLKLSTGDLEKYPVFEVKTKDKAGNEHTYKGTLLSVVLDSAGVTLGPALRGENLAKYVLITAADNYKVVYALPEIDPEFTSNTVLLATKVDGHPLRRVRGRSGWSTHPIKNKRVG